MAHDEESGSRPTPVRQVMESVEEEPRVEVESRVFLDEEEGEEWVARVEGRAGSGIIPLRVVPILELSFARTEDPEQLLRTVLCRGESLDDFREQELRALLRDARPVERKPEEPPARGSRRKGDRRKRRRRKK
jgi:hypothetical protein